ncbi:iota toxin protein Ib, partial [Bacillus anthracis]
AFIINKDEKNKLLSDEKQSVQSVRWKGSIQPSESGTYQFITSDNQQVQLKINEHSMIDYGDIRDGIPLKKGETYHIQIDYVPTTTDDATDFPSLQVFWKKDGGKQEEIPEQNLLRPNEETKQTRKKRDTSDTEQHEVKDTDNDNIFDIWEEEGYTIQNKLAVKWDENIHAKAGYTKYVSNPLSAHTSGDPYTDWEKVADDMDRSIKKEARDPLVAAYPVIGVGMEKMILSTNAISSSEAGRSVSVATSSSSTASNTLGMDVSAGYSMLQGFNAQITAQYAHTSSSTATTENTTGQTIGDSLQLNAGESAFLNANVRYYNTGTAPMYNVQPTTELVLGADTLSTIQAQANQIGDSLSPGETYPKKGVAPLA